MRIGSMLFLSGILTLVQFHELPPLFMIVLLPLFCALRLRYRLFRPALWYVSGFVWVLLVSHNILTKELAPDLEGEEIAVRGQVISLPSISNMYTQFDFDVSGVTDIDGKSRISPGKVRLNWYQPYPDILPGEEYELIVKLKRPRGYMNPGGFDYEAWLFQQRIRATGYVRVDNTVQEKYKRHFSFHSFRYYIREKLDRALPDSLVAKLVPALTLGDRSNMDNRHWRVLAATGTSHLLAISGLHIGLIAGFVFFLSRWIWALWSAGSNLIPASRLAAIISLLAAVFYALLAGFTIPTQRALMMIGVVILLNFMGRRTADSYVFVVALLAVLAFDPLAVLSAGFWLSFTAVLLILLALSISSCATGSTSAYKRIHQWGRVQVYIYIGLMPLLIVWFNQFPLLSLLANSIAIPWVTLICIPLIMLAVPVLLIHEQAGEFILGIGSSALDLLWCLLEYLAAVDLALLHFPDSTWFVLTASIIGIALLFLPTGLPGKWLGLICLLPLFLPWKDQPAKGEFNLTVLDVGQGLAVTVETQDHLLLYDTGPGYSSGFNAGWAIIAPFMKSSGLEQINALVLSHGDNDHIGGLNDILETIKVERILTSVPDKTGFIATESCLVGQHWLWDDVRFEILSPGIDVGLAGNNASCVLKVGNRKHAVLLSGDIEREAEMMLLINNRDTLEADILLAPHHGSATSSSPAFIRAVAPEHVIFSTGYLNRFGFPRQDIINRYRVHEVNMLNTAHDGAISIQFRHDQISIVKSRAKSLRYWHN